jgi:hypothetical protein
MTLQEDVGHCSSNSLLPSLTQVMVFSTNLNTLSKIYTIYPRVYDWDLHTINKLEDVNSRHDYNSTWSHTVPLFSCHKTTYFIINMQSLFTRLVQEILLLLLLLTLQPMGFSLLNPIILGFSVSSELDQISRFSFLK